MEKITLTINNKEVSAAPDKTILQVVKENKLDEIPTLCHDDRLEHFTACYLCVVEIEGMSKLVPSCATKITSGMNIYTRSERIVSTRKTALELIMSNHYADCIGPCMNNCPAGVDAQSYIALISMGQYEEALKVIKYNNPLPLSIGRVCVRDCENACRRNYVDESVAVNAMKRFVADFDAKDKWNPKLKQKKNKKVAVIGGGPAGLTCAYYLTTEGYSVTIFEKLPKLGGMLRYGIPEYRLPKNILDSEISWILDLGVEAKTNVELGTDFSIKDLLSSGYESVFISVGAHKASKLGLEGEEKIKGIYRGIDFLREVMLNNVPELNGTVVIVGGGNTALDAARTAVRCGAEKVKIVYRRSIKEMPAHHEEIEAAQKEGVEFLILTNPKSLVAEDGVLKGIECLQMGLEEGKPGERPKPVPIPGSEFVVECDYLISAIGQAVDTTFISYDNDIMLEKWGTMIVNTDTQETTIPGVFAGGDVVTGPLTAITSIAQGRKAAQAIMSYITYGHARKAPHKFYSLKHKLSTIKESEFEQFEKLAREKLEELEVEERIHSFKEVEKTFSEHQCESETGRCLECGCSEYADCTLRQYCDEYEVDVTKLIGSVNKYKVDNRHPFIAIDSNKCISCGKCVRVCSNVIQVSALGFVYRGFKSVVKPAMERPLLATNCIACGNCIDVCPTGSIAEKYPFKILGTLEKENYDTVCSFCSIGCKVNFKKINDDIFFVSNSTEEIKGSHNKGFLCSKGRFGYRYLYEKNRLFFPQAKMNGELHTISLEDAFTQAEKLIRSSIEKYGKESVAVFASPKLSNEELYLLQKLARTGFKNNNISSFTYLSKSASQNCLDDIFGFTSSTADFDDISSADIIVVVESNLTEDNLVLELKIKEAKKRGAKVVLINSSEISLSKTADLWIDAKKGSSASILIEVSKQLIKNNLISDSAKNKVTNLEAAIVEILNHTIDTAEQSLVAAEKLNQFYSLLNNDQNKIVFIYNIDSNENASAENLRSIANYLILSGRHGKNGNGIVLLRKHNNSAGMMELGTNQNYLPGFVTKENKKQIEQISKLWNAQLPDLTDDLLTKLIEKKIKLALVFGEDPANDEKLNEIYSKINSKIVFEPYNNKTTKSADLVFPVSSYIEEEGSYTRADNVVQESGRVVKSVNDYTNWQLIARLGRIFADGFSYDSREELNSEIEKVNRLRAHSNSNQSWIKNYYRNGCANEKLNLSVDIIVNEVGYTHDNKLHYQENYYSEEIKKKLF
ncbi:MAG: molybdopterin oxidoreductase [Ignavibacteria bacterium]|nr:MAG: molybdopterin oxidoreductase [Ignavibacteria bacterium]KAF0159946.1 MAG: molybdopterin oxidoreductase [Ignavibacteria bacterium]